MSYDTSGPFAVFCYSVFKDRSSPERDRVTDVTFCSLLPDSTSSFSCDETNSLSCFLLAVNTLFVLPALFVPPEPSGLQPAFPCPSRPRQTTRYGGGCQSEIARGERKFRESSLQSWTVTFHPLDQKENRLHFINENRNMAIILIRLDLQMRQARKIFLPDYIM